MFRAIILAALTTCFSGAAIENAWAACSWTPLANGTTADAGQVMDDLDCLAPVLNPHFSGSVGVGTSTPGATLDVRGNIGISLSGPREVGSLYSYADDGYLQLFTGQLAPISRIKLSAYGDSYISGAGGGNVGIGTSTPAQKLDVAGTIRQTGCTTAGTLSANASGDIICTSDERLKNIVGAYRSGLAALADIQPQRFTYKPTKNNPVETFVHAGFIAQNVRQSIPEATATQRDGYYSLDTTAVLAAAVNAIKELKAENDVQRKLNIHQDIEIRSLKQEIAKLATIHPREVRASSARSRIARIAAR